MHLKARISLLFTAGLAAVCANGTAQSARISETTRVLTTYPFSEPNPIPILTRDLRLYPYHTFEGYTKDAEQREWKVVHLENDLIEVFVLPEVGGKVWGAIVKETGHEFIYRNEVMKFRNIALRGPWTSGGIEFNFGVIGHTPATATPVDYTLRENPDGSVSCFVGTMDLPSRTQWRVEIRLPADRAYFETNVLWHNPTPLEQPYYNWMTAAAFAQYDLEMAMPGNAYLTHPGDAREWPIDPAGRYLPQYANNTFEGHKSYHVVGELNDFFGGYYHDDDYGFGHWSRYEEMPGQKLWLWALSREGGVWEDLLTDTDGQYVEFQAGRLLVQYSPGSDVNPITQAAFDPGAVDRWSETWFPLEGLGGLTDASRDGAMFVTREAGTVSASISAFGDMADTLRVWSDDRLVASIPTEFVALEASEYTFDIPDGSSYRVELPALGLDYSSDPSTRELARPFVTDPNARPQIPAADVHVFEARELAKGRRYKAARELFEAALTEEPWHREAMLGLADLEYRRGLYESGLTFVNRVLQLNAYDASANLVAGNLYRALGSGTDAREAFGWAARSMAYRSVAYLQLAELSLAAGDISEAERYVRFALEYDHNNISALQVLAMVARKTEDSTLASSVHDWILGIDPLNHFVEAEAVLLGPGSSAANLLEVLRSEYPEQTLLELSIDYYRRGAPDDAARVLDIGNRVFGNPLLRVWQAWLEDDPSMLAAVADPTFVFPFRRETLPVLEWAAEQNDQWLWSYLLALNLWALDREDEAAARLEALESVPDFAPMYVARAVLLEQLYGRDQVADLRRAVELDGSDRTIRIHLIRNLQSMDRWEDALTESATGRALFHDDFNIDLLHVRSLNQLGRPLEATEILANTHVLPSENARESHRLYEQAHTMAALDAMDSGDHEDAHRFLQAALEWPERLGQGRPYEPEERIVLYLLGQVESTLGNRDRARAAFESVVAATDRRDLKSERLDLLSIPALVGLGSTDALTRVAFDQSMEVGLFARGLIGTIERGDDVDAVVTRLAVEHAALFEDLVGSILLRALTAADYRGGGR
jgi:tetratricopeptide (TPR) repeat protein